jgi:hypothetical protein
MKAHHVLGSDQMIEIIMPMGSIVGFREYDDHRPGMPEIELGQSTRGERASRASEIDA